jgi:UDP-glucose 4-epimerase
MDDQGGQRELLESAYRGARVLVTGGLGFIGSNLALHLVSLGAKVLVVDSLIPQYGGNLHNLEPVRDRVAVNIADVRDVYSMNYLVQGQDYIFNLAGQVSHLDSMVDPVTDLEINCRSQLTILEACRRHNPGVKVVYAGTRQQYGRPDYLPVDERHLMHPTDINGVNKMAGEWYHIVYNNAYGVRACSLRLTNTYGPRMRIKDARQTFLGWWLRLALEGRPIEIYGDGSQVRDFNYVDDVAHAFLLAGASERANGQVYNLGSPEPLSLRELAGLLSSLCPRCSYSLIPWPADRKAIDIGSYYGDYGKIRRELAWEPLVSLRDGLERTLAYFAANLEHYL